MTLDWIYIAVHVVFYGVLFSFALVGLYRKLKPSNNSSIELNELTLIVPFRNEEGTILSLLEDIRKQEKLPNKLIFVDDHSEDEGAAFIRNELNEFNLEVVGLPSDKFGKKEAIKLGISKVKTKYVLTIDADVHIDSNYFQNLQLLDEADMWILPVQMTGESFFQQFASIDFTLSNILNRCFSVFKRPVLASGANLLFKTESYEKCSVDNHFDVLSGDDMFLLRDFRSNKLDVRVTSDQRLQVTTETPDTLKDWMDQRIRWISKSQRVGDLVPLIFGIANLSMGVFFYLALISVVISDPWNAFYLIVFKLFYDTLLMAPHFISDNNEKALWILPIYNILLPVYSVFLALSSTFYTPVWKGRDTKQKKAP